MHWQMPALVPGTGRRRAARHRVVSLICVAFAVGPVTASARAAGSVPVQLTLSQAVSRALAGGAAARIARLETHRAQESFGAARGGYLPHVAVTSEAGWSNRFNETFTALDQNNNVKRYGLASIGADRGWFNVYLSQVLFDLRQWKLIEREQLQAEAASIQERRQRDEVAFEVTRRYAALLRARREAGVAQEKLANAQWLLEQADARLEAGRTLQVEHSLAGLHRESARLDTEAAGYDVSAAEAELWIAVGEDEQPNAPLELVPESLPPIEHPLSLGQAAELVSAAPELRLLELRRRIDRASVEAARAGRLPQLKLVTGYSHYGIKRYDNYNDEVWVGIDLSIPVFDGFQALHEIRGAEDAAEIAGIRYDATLQAKQARVRELLKRLEMGRQRLGLARERAEAAAEQERLADVNLRAERAGVAEALAAREARSRFAQEAIDAYFDQLELWASLQRELGRLSSEILGSAPAPATTP
jgi:outer membrane protein